jgi:hypothetical protein
MINWYSFVTEDGRPAQPMREVQFDHRPLCGYLGLCADQEHHPSIAAYFTAFSPIQETADDLGLAELYFIALEDEIIAFQYKACAECPARIFFLPHSVTKLHARFQVKVSPPVFAAFSS